MSTWIFRVIRWVVGLLVAVILLGICALFVAGRLGAFDGYGSCIPAGRAEVVDELREGDQTLYLVYRVTGFRKHVEFYELYATLPSFDVCADSKDEPLDVDSVFFPAEGMRVKDVLVRNTKKYGPMLEIRYTRQADEGVSPNQAKLVRADTLELNPEDHPRLWHAENTMETDEGILKKGHDD